MTTKKTPSTRCILRRDVESNLASIKGKAVNISSPAYRLVQALSDHIDAHFGTGPSGKAPSEQDGKPLKSYNTPGLIELKLVLQAADRQIKLLEAKAQLAQ